MSQEYYQTIDAPGPIEAQGLVLDNLTGNSPDESHLDIKVERVYNAEG